MSFEDGSGGLVGALVDVTRLPERYKGSSPRPFIFGPFGQYRTGDAQQLRIAAAAPTQHLRQPELPVGRPQRAGRPQIGLTDVGLGRRRKGRGATLRTGTAWCRGPDP